MPFHQLRGLPGFFLLWLGQACSLLGGSMALFAVTLWVYQTTGQATPIALLGFFQMTPMVVVSLFAGALVDRYDRRLMLMMGDLATLAICLFLVVGSWTGGIQLWQIYTAGAILGTFQSFQWPATSAAVTLMVDKKHYARAASLLEMAGMSSGILAPLLAGSLLGFLGLPGILGMTAAGSLLAVVSLLFIHFPPKERSVPVPLVKIFSEIGEGIRFVLKRPPLIAVQITFLLGNFFFNLCFPLLGPLVLGRTGNNALAFAAVETAGAIGGLVGSALIAVWGGPQNRVLGILAGWTGSGLLGTLIIGLGPDLPFWFAGSLVGSAFGSLNYTSNQSLWQSKVSADLQGRVFAVRRTIAMGVIPLANLAAGPLADRVLEPAMVPGGALTPWLGPIFGTGPGAGIKVLFALCGLALALLGPAAWTFSLVREAERRLPDA